MYHIPLYYFLSLAAPKVRIEKDAPRSVTLICDNIPTFSSVEWEKDDRLLDENEGGEAIWNFRDSGGNNSNRTIFAYRLVCLCVCGRHFYQ